MKMPRLTEVFRWIKEARFPWEKFPAPYERGQERPRTFSPEPALTPKETLPPLPKQPAKALDVIPRPTAETAEQLQGPDSFAGNVSMDPRQAAEAGWRKVQGFVVNPKHWKRGSEGDYNSMDWMGTYLAPKTEVARRFVRLFGDYHLRADQVYDRRVWDKAFKADLGDIEED